MVDDMIKFHCNNCGQKFNVPESQAGKSGRCPKCKSVVFIPDVRKSTPVPQQENSSQPQNEPRYSAFDLTLLEVPQIGEAHEKQTGESEKAAEPKDRITQTPEQSEEEPAAERRFPWLIDVFLYPANRSGLVILGVIIALRWFSIIVIRNLGFSTPALSPMVVIVVPLICISYIVKGVLYAFFYWYLCECTRDSAEGGFRAPETIHKTPGLWELLWLLRSVVCFIVFTGPVLAYHFSTQRTDIQFWIWFVFGVLLLPISILAFVMFDSLTSALNPIVLLGSIRSVFLQYCALILVFLTAGFFIVTIVKNMDFTLIHKFIIHCAVLYILMVMAHILGWFYNRYRQQLNWDV
jgi:DNA-directed RNA polymerase subunit RPC12/RpoP